MTDQCYCGAGWSTQEASRKPWADVPEANRETMRIAVRALLAHVTAEQAKALRAWVLSDETIEPVARAIALLEPGEDWPTNADLGGGLTGTRDDEYRDGAHDDARHVLAALADLIGGTP